MERLDPENTVASIRDDLDDYGAHLPVVIESTDGSWFNVDDIRSQDTARGPVVVIDIGNKITEAV